MRTTKIRKFGWLRDSLDGRDRVLTVSKRVPLPAECDLIGPQMPPIYDQGDLGSCSANAISRAVDFERAKQGLPFMTPSRLMLYWCEREMEGTVETDSGAMLRDGIKVMVKQGVCAESEWPYDISQFAVRPTEQCFKDAIPHETVQYSSVTQSRDLYFAKHCMAILGRPVVFGISVFEDFESEEVSKTGLIPMPQGNPLGGHAICMVGYDDSKKLIKFANSWGADWGSAGYGFLPYEYVADPNLSADWWVVLAERG